MSVNALITNAPSRQHVRRFAGRDREVAELAGLLSADHARVITVWGTSGVGRRRLVTETLAHLSFLQLAARAVEFDFQKSSRSGAMLATIVERLTGSPVMPGGDACLESAVGLKPILLVLNVGAAVSEAGSTVRALQSVPAIRVLVISDQPLQVSGERALQVCPLEPSEHYGDSVPHDDPAIAILADSAVEVNPSLTENRVRLEDLTHAARVFGGVPLALEIGGRALGARLAKGGSLGSITVEADGVSTALRLAYEDMSPTAKAVFLALSRIEGSGDADVVAWLTGEESWETSQALVDLRLLGVVESNDAMAEHFTVRAEVGTFSRLLASRKGGNESSPTPPARVAQYYVDFLAHHSPVGEQATREDILGRMEWQHANLEVAMRWVNEQNAGEPALTFIAQVADAWWLCGRMREAVSWLEPAVANSDPDPETKSRAELTLGRCLAFLGDEKGVDHLRRALAHSRRRNEKPAVARALTHLGALEVILGNSAGVELLMEASRIYRLMGGQAPRRLLAETQAYYGGAQLALGNADRAAMHLQAALRTLELVGDERAAAMVQPSLAAAQIAGEVAGDGVANIMASLDTSERLGDPYLMAHALDAVLMLAGPVRSPLIATVLGARDVFSRPAGFRTHIFNAMPGIIPPLWRRDVISHHRDAYLLGGGSSVAGAALVARTVIANAYTDLVATRTARTLTAREERLLQLIAEGRSDDEIVGELGISRRTLRRVNTTMMTKLGAASRPHAIAIAARSGYISLPAR